MPGDRCKNCDHPLSAEAHFCEACGQSVKEYSRPWVEMVREVLEETLDWDGRMFRSISLLVTHPGFLSAEYIRGRRKAYTPPIRMYLVISLLFFLVLPLILPVPSNVSADHQFSVDLYSKGMFVMLPVFALLLKLLYRRFYYWDHLVFSIYLFSASYIVFAFLLSLETLADRYLAAALVQVVLLIYMVAYWLLALRRVYADTWCTTAMKFSALLLLFLPALAMLIEGVSHTGGMD